MSKQESIITLFSSDSTDRYIKDIFTVLALPRGSVYKFTYQDQYIDPKVYPIFDDQSRNLNIKAIIAFRSNSETGEAERFYVPVRWVNIISIERISSSFIVNFEIKGYPQFTNKYMAETVSFDGINKWAVKIFSQKEKNETAVWGEQLPGVENDDDKKERDNQNWYSIVNRLTYIPKYEDYQFFKCSNPYIESINDNNEREKRECVRKGNYLALTEGKCINIDIDYYSENYDKNKKRKICVLVDDNVIRKTKGLHTILQSRYGSIRLGLQPKNVSNSNTLSEVIIYTTSTEKDELETEITFPIIVVKNRFYKAFKAIVMAVGALLVGTPGITNNNLDIRTNILIAGIGVLVLGVSNYWELKE